MSETFKWILFGWALLTGVFLVVGLILYKNPPELTCLFNGILIYKEKTEQGYMGAFNTGDTTISAELSEEVFYVAQLGHKYGCYCDSNYVVCAIV